MSLKAFSVFTSFKAKDGISPVIQNMNSKTAVFSGRLSKMKSQIQGFGQNAQKSFGGMKAAIGGVVAAATTGVVVTTLNSWVEKASDLQETLGKTNETFKADSNAVIEWSKTSIKSMGLAQQTALDTAALYGDMGSGMGMTTKRAAEMATSLTQLSADLASFKNMSQDVTKNALKGIFTGETEALKNLGTVMTQENLEDFAKKIGAGKKFKNMTQSEKIELRYKYVWEATKNSHGDFAKTGGNFANLQKTFQEQKLDLETKMGEIMLPKYTSVMKALSTILEKYSPIILKGFGSLFKNFEEGLKICSPLFEKFKNLFKTFATTIMPMFQRSMPTIKTLLSTVVVPALGLVIDSINVLLKVTTSIYRFVKNNWLPILAIALPMAIGITAFQITQFQIQCKLAALAGQNLTFASTTLGKVMLGLKGGLIGIGTSLISVAKALKMSTLACWGMTKAFVMSPIGLITLGVVALVAGVILLWKNWDKVTKAFKKFGEMFENFKRRHPKIFGNGSSIKIEGVDGKDVQQKQPKVKGNKNGSIEVKTTIDNRTGYNAQTSTSLQSPNGLSLKPA